MALPTMGDDGAPPYGELALAYSATDDGVPAFSAAVDVGWKVLAAPPTTKELRLMSTDELEKMLVDSKWGAEVGKVWVEETVHALEERVVEGDPNAHLGTAKCSPWHSAIDCVVCRYHCSYRSIHHHAHSH